MTPLRAFRRPLPNSEPDRTTGIKRSRPATQTAPGMVCKHTHFFYRYHDETDRLLRHCKICKQKAAFNDLGRWEPFTLNRSNFHLWDKARWMGKEEAAEIVEYL